MDLYNNNKIVEKDNKLKEIIEDLNGRTRELECIYKVDEALRNFDTETEEAFNNVLNIIPEGWRYSDICKIRIIYGENSFESEGFTKTELKQTARINVDDTIVGEIQVFYIKPVKSEKGIFLPSEQKLLNTIAEKLSNFILYKKLKQTISEAGKEKTNKKTSKEADKISIWLEEAGLNNKEIETICKLKINFRKGETICKQGAITSYVMILAEGMTKHYLEGIQEKGFTFKIVNPFEFIGLSSLFGNNIYHFSSIAITPSSVYLVDKEDFKRLIFNNNKFASFIMENYCGTTDRLLKRLSCIANKNSLGRIAEILLYLSEEVFKNSIINVSISRKNIAELAGMSTESAVRILSDLKNDKIIKISKEGITIEKPELLKTLSIAG